MKDLEGAVQSHSSEIFGRNRGVFTDEVMELLARSHVSIAGMGGPGRATAEVLVRWGIGSIRIADFDIYEIHNLNRQLDAFHSTLGREKTDVAYERLLDINPNLNLEVYAQGVTVENAKTFTSNTDVIVDALDYFAPEARIELYKQSRKNNKYVFSSPAAGLGALILCFDPEGMTVEEAFGFPDDPEKVATHDIPLQKIIGMELDYLPKMFHETLKGERPYVSTNSSSVMLAAGATSVQILKLLIAQEREYEPSSFPEYGVCNVVTVPHALRFDSWGMDYCQLVDLREV